MSLIFEALRRSESERTGRPLSESTATELLRGAENGSADARAEKGEPKRLLDVATGGEAIGPKSDMPYSSFVESTVTEPRHAQEVRTSVSPESRLVCSSEQWSLAAEKFRLLGLRLRHLSQKRPLKKVLVTSTIAGEGKSFVCANLAITMSRKKGQRVLLIDGDLRRPVLTERFGLGQLSGLSDCLKNGLTVLKSIYHVQEFNFWLLPAGNQSDNALELMQSGHLTEMLQELGGSFDWSIIDSPPLIPLADTAFWSKLADGTLLVARQGKSERRALQRGLEMIDRSSLLGVVLNATSSSDHESYYQHYGYGTYPPQGRTAS